MASKPYFQNVPSYGDLRIDYILVDYDYHLLFTLKNDQDQYFICTCFDTRGAQQWLLSPISVNRLLNLLQNQIPIHTAFLGSDRIIHAKLDYKTREEVFTTLPVSNTPREWLPTPGEYLNPDPDEFDDYIKILDSEN